MKNKCNVDDFWMGIVDLIKSGSPVKDGSATILVDYHNTIAAQTFDVPVGKYSQKYISSDSVIFDNGVGVGLTMYTTHTPSYESCLNIIHHDVKKIVYRETRVLEQEIIELTRAMNVKFQVFKGNLTWIRDYGLMLKSEIFLENKS